MRIAEQKDLDIYATFGAFEKLLLEIRKDFHGQGIDLGGDFCEHDGRKPGVHNVADIII